MPLRSRSLFALIAFRLALASLLALACQVVIVVVMTLRSKDDLGRSYILTESKVLAEGLSWQGDTLEFRLPSTARYYDQDKSYGLRVSDMRGHVVFERNAELIARASPWTADQPHTSQYWYHRDWALHFSGGDCVHILRRQGCIEVATAGDPAGARWRTVRAEIFEDTLVPMVPLILLLFGVATVSIRASLRPLADAALRADHISQIGQERFSTKGMPLEAASFATAINSLLDRIAALLEAQKFFLTRAAHELRTPLSIMLLELGRITDSRARRLEIDVASMTSAVDRLLVLARLEAMEVPDYARVDLAALAEETVSQLRPWVVQNGHEINLIVPEGNCEADVDVVAVREALRNLVENAVKHTPAETQIEVTIRPNLEIAVEDNGPGIAHEFENGLFEPFMRGNSSADGTGLGLNIVKRAAELHGGSLSYRPRPGGGAAFTLRVAPEDHHIAPVKADS